MRVILDEGVPPELAHCLTGHEISTVKIQGWRGTKNGKLLDLIEGAGFEALVTNDKRMEHENNLRLRPFATLVLSVSNWNIIRERLADIQMALDQAQPGTVRTVDCGTFVPKRFRPPSS